MGKLIVIDGPEGSGKSSIITRLKLIFGDDDNVIFSKEPGGSVIRDQLRRLIVDDSYDIHDDVICLLLKADRIQHLHELILPNIDTKTIILDRYETSTYVYQGIMDNKMKLVNYLNNSLLHRSPDVFIHIDVSAEVGLERSKAKAIANGTNELRFENKGLEYNQCVREGFFKYASEVHKKKPYLYINSDDKTETQVFEEVYYFIKSFM